MELQPILHVWINHDHDLVDLTISSHTHPPLKAGQQREAFHTTQKHPFLTLEKGFLPVSQITLGMHVLRADGSVGTITGWKVVPGAATMYNLEGAQDHTYTVGDGLWVVHNCAQGGSDWIKQLPKDPQTLIDQGWQDVTHPQAKLKSSSTTLVDPATGRTVRFDQGVSCASGFTGKDHYHVYNPVATGDGDRYLDINGNPVPKNSRASHILPGGN